MPAISKTRQKPAAAALSANMAHTKQTGKPGHLKED